MGDIEKTTVPWMQDPVYTWQCEICNFFWAEPLGRLPALKREIRYHSCRVIWSEWG